MIFPALKIVKYKQNSMIKISLRLLLCVICFLGEMYDACPWFDRRSEGFDVERDVKLIVVDWISLYQSVSRYQIG